MTTAQAFALALEHHQTGRLAEAEALYRQILVAESNHAEALHHLGIIAKQAGRLDVAVQLMGRAIALNPENSAAHYNLGETWRMMGRLNEAVASFHLAIQFQPDFSEAHNNLGIALAGQEKGEEAVAAFRRALELAPDSPGTLINLGNALRERGHFDEAVTVCRRALAFKPDSPEALNNLGLALSGQGRIDEAMAAYRQAREGQPDYPEARNNLGIALFERGRIEEAMAAYRSALGIRPGYPEALNNLGLALFKQGQIEEAMAAYRQALQFKPNYADALNNLGNALREKARLEEALAAYRQMLQLRTDSSDAHINLGTILAMKGRLEEAMAMFQRALRLKPDSPDAYNNLGSALREWDRFDEAVGALRRALELKPSFSDAWKNLGNTLKDRGQLEEAVAAYRRALDLQPDHALVHSNLIYALHYQPTQNGQMIAEEQQRWNRQFGEPLQRFIQPHTNDPDPHRRLRIGYVSPDFRSHAVSFFLAPLLEAHDHGACEIYCYASLQRRDAMTERLRKSADAWREVRTFSDAQLAECVRADGINILVDLAMHTGDNRLPAFARKPAPVQVSWLAYPGSTGLDAIDYRLTDAHIDPDGEEDERPGGRAMRLPDSWCCYAPLEEFPLVGPLPAAQNGTVTFGSFNQFSKVHEGTLLCWATLLGTVPDSRLIMICPEGQARERTQRLFAARGIAWERVKLVARCPWPEYIRLFAGLDIALDTYPGNGMTTTCHALWMGVPVVTLSGPSAVSRAGNSLLHALGLPELVAPSDTEYIRIAAALAADLVRLAELRRTLRPRMQASPLMDAPRFARNVEVAYRAMWQRWCAENQSSPR